MNERIKLLRQKLNLTQTEFAQKIGLQANTITTYEMGVRNPRDSNILIICREFNVNEEWLRNGNGEMFLSPEHSAPVLLTQNERVKEVRIHFKMSLEEFGSRIGVQKTAIHRAEKNVNGVSNQMIKSICREFSVNEEWLRKGSGEMFLNSEENTNFKERIIGAVTVMDEFTAKEVWNFIKNIS